MDADEAAGSSRSMDQNLYLGLPRVPRPRRSDLSLGTPMPSSSAASIDAPPPPEPLPRPRPHGNRLESFNQQFHNMRPISRRLGEAHVVLSSWRRLLDQHIMSSASRIEGSSEAGQGAAVPVPRHEPVGTTAEANKVTAVVAEFSVSDESTEDRGKSAGPAIPPRPHGNRIESFNQQFHNMRPISRRLGEAHVILSSWRRLLDQQIMSSASRIEGSSEAVQEINDNGQHTGHPSRFGTLASRMRARRLQRETESATEGGTSGPDSVLPGNDTSESSRCSSTPLDLPEHLSMIGTANMERLTAAMSDLRRIASPSQYGGSTSPLNPQSNEPTVGPTHVSGGPSADQASNSSTVAVIQGDAGISESTGEPSNAGSSSSLRRTRSNTLGSLDVDGGGLQGNKRHRMN